MLHVNFVRLFMNLNAVPLTIISQATPSNFSSYKMQTGTLIYTFADIMIILRMKNLVQEAAVPLTLVQKVVNNRQPK